MLSYRGTAIKSKIGASLRVPRGFGLDDAISWAQQASNMPGSPKVPPVSAERDSAECPVRL